MIICIEDDTDNQVIVYWKLSIHSALFFLLFRGLRSVSEPPVFLPINLICHSFQDPLMTISTRSVYPEDYPIAEFLVIAITMAVLLLVSVYFLAVTIVIVAVLVVLGAMLFLRLLSNIQQFSRLHSISSSQISNH